jgi:Terminase RNaseH-like domain
MVPDATPGRRRAPCIRHQGGGIDFGYRNPFAAIWGVLDRDDVLWLTGEHYCRQRPLSYHATQIPKDVMWYADPSGAADISELRVADFKVRKGNNAIALGIAAVNSRIADGRLKILNGACPNLLMEAGLYRYEDPESHGGENPVNEYNHALGALRYMVARRPQNGPTPTERRPQPPW